MHGSGSHAAAFLTDRVPAELTWRDGSPEIGRKAGGEAGELALPGRAWRVAAAFEDKPGQMYLRKMPGGGQFVKQGVTVLCAQPLGGAIVLLRCVDAEPDSPHFSFRPVRPEPAEVAQVTRPFQHRPGNGAVHDHTVRSDMLQDAIVGCRGAPPVVFPGQAVNRDDQVQGPDEIPFLRDRTNGAGDELHLHAHLAQDWQKPA